MEFLENMSNKSNLGESRKDLSNIQKRQKKSKKMINKGINTSKKSLKESHSVKCLNVENVCQIHQSA